MNEANLFSGESFLEEMTIGTFAPTTALPTLAPAK